MQAGVTPDKVFPSCAPWKSVVCEMLEVQWKNLMLSKWSLVALQNL